MLKLSKVAILSVLLFTSAHAGSFSGGANLFSGGKKSRGNFTTNTSLSHDKSGVTALDSYCYCPAKHGTIGVTHFAFDSSEVLPAARKLIDHEIAKCVAMRLAEDSEIKVLITGHADKRGTQEYNLALGTRRADATKDYIVSAIKNAEEEGVISEDRFCTSSKGKEELVDNGETEAAHAKNRRAVIEFVDECN